ncbi:hypothetical protein [Streptomyces sp. 35G-GA-8]|uniref:hypothetical protein n=1 Tax=Streptomyces sp. 35G-GA-8 TaxID=2939434 RepID=UPI00201EC6E7|nr:hypothetical protein [Streptomyces sp. 35G-GA-8]MCL7377426.1 hypothetical protein [Streptomyces sp. 35G-GA-8]
MSARESLHSDLLTTPMAATLPYPEGWASIRLQRYRDEVRAEVLGKAVAFLEEIGTPITGDRTGHERGVMYAARRLTEQIAPGPVEKTTPNGAAVTPQPEQSGEWAPAGALRDRLATLLTHIRRHPSRTWTTEDVRRFYLSQAPKRATCRRDLQSLRAMGWLVLIDEPGRRFYRLNTRKDGAS